jgi:hypothetical protein
VIWIVCSRKVAIAGSIAVPRFVARLLAQAAILIASDSTSVFGSSVIETRVTGLLGDSDDTGLTAGGPGMLGIDNDGAGTTGAARGADNGVEATGGVGAGAGETGVLGTNDGMARTGEIGEDTGAVRASDGEKRDVEETVLMGEVGSLRALGFCFLDDGG